MTYADTAAGTQSYYAEVFTDNGKTYSHFCERGSGICHIRSSLRQVPLQLSDRIFTLHRNPKHVIQHAAFLDAHNFAFPRKINRSKGMFPVDLDGEFYLCTSRDHRRASHHKSADADVLADGCDLGCGSKRLKLHEYRAFQGVATVFSLLPIGVLNVCVKWVHGLLVVPDPAKDEQRPCRIVPMPSRTKSWIRLGMTGMY